MASARKSKCPCGAHHQRQTGWMPLVRSSWNHQWRHKGGARGSWFSLTALHCVRCADAQLRQRCACRSCRSHDTNQEAPVHVYRKFQNTKRSCSVAQRSTSQLTAQRRTYVSGHHSPLCACSCASCCCSPGCKPGDSGSAPAAAAAAAAASVTADSAGLTVWRAAPFFLLLR